MALAQQPGNPEEEEEEEEEQEELFEEEFVIEDLVVFENQDVELPVGTLIDLRFSGMLVPENSYSSFAQSRDRIILLCNKKGLPDRYLFGGRTELLAGKTSLLLREYLDFEPINIADPEERRIEIARRVFETENAYWVTTNPRTGTTNSQRVVKPKTADSVHQIVMDSKVLTRPQ